MGETRTNIERPGVQRLTGKIPLIQKGYINTLKKLIEDIVYYVSINNLFGNIPNGLIKDKPLILR